MERTTCRSRRGRPRRWENDEKSWRGGKKKRKEKSREFARGKPIFFYEESQGKHRGTIPYWGGVSSELTRTSGEEKKEGKKAHGADEMFRKR